MTRVFFRPLLSCNFDDHLSSDQIFTGMLFCAYVEIHQVRRQVFDNYQRCPVSLIKVMVCCMGYPTLFLISFNEFKTLPARLILVHISPILYKLCPVSLSKGHTSWRSLYIHVHIRSTGYVTHNFYIFTK